MESHSPQPNERPGGPQRLARRAPRPDARRHRGLHRAAEDDRRVARLADAVPLERSPRPCSARPPPPRSGASRPVSTRPGANAAPRHHTPRRRPAGLARPGASIGSGPPPFAGAGPQERGAAPWTCGGVGRLRGSWR